MKKYRVYIGIFAVALTVLVFYFFCIHREWSAKESLSRAQVAKMLAFLKYDQTGCEEILEDTKDFLPTDVDSDQWYGKYVAVVLKEELMDAADDKGFHPLDKFCYEDLVRIMEKFHLSEESLSFSIKKHQPDGMVPRSQWCEVYKLLITDNLRVQKKKTTVYGTSENTSGLKAWQIVTAEGVKMAEGLSLNEYCNREIEVYEAMGEILCVVGFGTDASVMENVWIKSTDDNQLHVFYKGYDIDVSMASKTSDNLEENMGDLIFEKGELRSIRYKTSRIKASLDEIGDDYMVLNGYGKLSVLKNMVMYQIYPDPKEIEKEVLRTDGTVYEFVLEGEAICGLIYQAYSEERIRILLHGEENSYEQSEAVFTSDEKFMVISGNEVTRYNSGEQAFFETKDSAFAECEEVQIKTEDPEGKIEILSLERQGENPQYRGTICLSDSDEGLRLINEVNIEDYVAGVIPSEMPVSYGIEALKVQAVCARTFAMRSLDGNFKGYPAHLDDTVASQVYNNVPECEESIRAAGETKGQVLKNEEGLTPTYFFSTSCGHTSDAADVWYDGGENIESVSKSVFLSDDSVSLDLKKEEDFRRFIDREDGYHYFEENLSWFRWQVYLTGEDIANGLLSFLGQNIGNLSEVNVRERGSSGILKAVDIKGDEGTYTVYGEYNIRNVFSPANAEIMTHTGECVTGWKMLPSGYFYLDPVREDGDCQGYMLYGGGYGHGCGLSQNGAMKMAEAGKTYEEILTGFFPDSQIIAE